MSTSCNSCLMSWWHQFDLNFHCSRHILGGFCAVIYYFSIHKDATRLQTNPTSRDNFAFPFLFGQMYFLSAWIEAHNRHYANERGGEPGYERGEEKVKIVQVRELLRIRKKKRIFFCWWYDGTNIYTDQIIPFITAALLQTNLVNTVCICFMEFRHLHIR